MSEDEFIAMSVAINLQQLIISTLIANEENVPQGTGSMVGMLASLTQVALAEVMPEPTEDPEIQGRILMQLMAYMALIGNVAEDMLNEQVAESNSNIINDLKDL